MPPAELDPADEFVAARRCSQRSSASIVACTQSIFAAREARRRRWDDGGAGAFFANAGDDLHAVGSLAPLIEGAIGCIVIRRDGSRYVARVVADPTA